MTQPWQDFAAAEASAPDSTAPIQIGKVRGLGAKPWEDFASGKIDQDELQKPPLKDVSEYKPTGIPTEPIRGASPDPNKGMDYVEPAPISAITAVGMAPVAAGRVLAAGAQDVVEQLANRLKGFKNTESKWRNTMSLGPIGELEQNETPTPYEQDLDEQKGVTKLAGDLSNGIIKTLPQLYVGGEVAGGLKTLGFTERAAQAVGMGGAFGFDKNGFDVKQAAIMAAFPGVAEYGGKVAEGTLARLGVKPESELARGAIHWVGSLAGSQAYMDATQVPQYVDPNLTPEQKRDLFINNLAQNIAFHLYSLPGMAVSGIQGDQMNAAAKEAAAQNADIFWKGQEAKKLPKPDLVENALRDIYGPKQPAPVSDINNRIRQQVSARLAASTQNRMRAPLSKPVSKIPESIPTPTPEVANATRTQQQEISSQPQHQGTPQGQNLQPNAPQEWQEGGRPAGGGDRPVGAAPQPNAPPEVKPELITAAAYRDADGTVHTAPNHPAIMRRLAIPGFETRESRNTPQFGFTTSTGRFITRQEAAELAKANGQQLKEFGVDQNGNEIAHSNEVSSPVEPGKPLSDVDRGARLNALKRLTNPTPDEIEERDALQKESDAVQGKMAASFAALKKEALRPKPDWKVVVQAPVGEVPGYVQIIDPTQPEASKSPTVESIRAAGHEAPDFSKLPSGSYTWQEALDKSAELPQIATDAGRTDITGKAAPGVVVRKPPRSGETTPPEQPAPPVPGGQGPAGAPGGGRNVAGRPKQGGGKGSVEQPDTGSTGRTGDDTGPSAPAAPPEGAAGGPPEPDLNHVLPQDQDWIPAGSRAKANANLAAIRLLKKLEAENRNPTPEEKAVLAQYTGWGGLKQVFDEGKAAYRKRPAYYPEQQKEAANWEKQWGKLYDAVKQELSEDEWDHAARSVLNAHYTSRDVINAIWKAAERMGFTGGRVLEAGAGVGNFIGLTPGSVRGKTKWTAVELDDVSGRLLAKLYPQATVHQTGFEKAVIPINSQDMMIGNVPFAAEGPRDERYPNFSLHNYFLARGMDLLKPGGLMAVVTSDSTMDNMASRRAREYLSDRADLVGAIRLPNNAFEKNAGTEVTTDVLFFRKRDGTPFDGKSFVGTGEAMTYKNEPVEINQYFIDNPDMMLGKLSMEGEMYAGGNHKALIPVPGADLTTQMDEAISKLPVNVIGTQVTPEELSKPPAARADKGAKVGGLVLKDGKVQQVEADGTLSDPAWSGDVKKVAQATRYIAVRDSTKDYIGKMLDPNVTDGELASERMKLNNAYDQYVKKHGPINSRNSRFLDDDVDYPMALALEDENFKTVKLPDGREKKEAEYTKSKLFHERTIFPRMAPERVDTVGDALDVSVNFTGKVDPDYIAKLTGKNAEAVKTEMRETGIAFENPETGLWESRATYLSGFVKDKLAEARKVLRENPNYAANVRELEKVQPARIPIAQISVKLGATWVPTDLIERFLRDVLEVNADVHYIPQTGTWRVSPTSGWTGERNLTTFGAHGWKGHEIVDAALNLKQPVVYDVIGSGKDEKKVRNPAKTAEASLKQDQLQKAWQEWSKTWPDVAKRLEDLYNDYFNGVVAPKFDGPNWTHYPGASTDVTLRDHQKEVATRMIQNSTLLAHAVGTGKTFAMITAAQEMKRLGLARKPMIVVQNATLEQFARSYKRLYPTAKILVPGSTDRDSKRRNKTMSRIATGDWDCVIIPQSFVNMLPDDPQREHDYIKAAISELKDAKIDAAAQAGKRSPKTADIQRAIERLEKRLQELMDRKVDNVLTFEQLGVDALFVDEAHAYKKLEFATQMDNIKGLDKGASQRAFSMFMKVRWVQEHNQGRNVTFATGTPVSNTLAEAWNMMRFVRPDVLKKYHMEKFDDFASTFGDRVTNMEMTAGGTWKPVTRFAKFTNGPELISAWRTVADVVMPEKLNLPGVPRLKNGKPTAVVIPQSPVIKSYIERLRGMLEAFEAMSGQQKRENSHIPLVVFGLAKKASLDMRMIDPALADEPVSKLNSAADNIYRVFKESTSVKGAQMVFADIYQDNPENPRFNVYEEMKRKLIERGIPADQIAIVTPELKDAKREALFKKVNDGDIRVIMGSSERMGVGVNAQEHLIGLHHLDAPHRPMDIEQRTGRMLRQGNSNPEVEEFRYGVENTLDAALFQKLATKQKFINQILRGDVTGRDFEDAANEQSLSYEEQMAAFSGDKRTIEKFGLENQVRQLEGLKNGYFRQIRDARAKIERIEKQDLPESKRLLTTYQGLAAQMSSAFPEGWEPTLQRGMTMTTGRKAVVPVLESVIKELMDDANARVAKRVNMKETIRSKVVEIKINGHPITLYAEIPIEWTTGAALPESAVVNWHFSEYANGKGEIRTGGGLLTSITAVVQRIQKEPGFMEQRIANQEKDLKELGGFVQQPFDQEKELENAHARLATLNAELLAESQKKPEAPPAETEAGEEGVQAQIPKVESRPVTGSGSITGIASGPEEIREMLAKSKLPARAVQVAAAMLDQPVMQDLDWSKLTVTIRDRLKGGAHGMAHVLTNLIQLSENARASTFPHEVFHLLHEMLPQRYLDTLNELRLDELRKIYGDNIPEDLRGGVMSTDQFVAAGLPWEQYPLSSTTEFLADFAGRKFAVDQFAARNQSLITEMKNKVTGWVRGIVNAVKRVLRVRPDLNQAYHELLAGTWTPTPDTARAYSDESQAQLARTRSEYEKQKTFEEPGTPERAMAAYGDVVEMKRKAADSIDASERARKMTMLTNQELMTQIASADMASQRLTFGNYDAMRARTEGSDQGLRSGVIIDAWRGMSYEQHRMIQLRAKLEDQKSVVSSRKFLDMLNRFWATRAEADAAKDTRKTFTNQVSTEAGEVVRQLNAAGKTDAKMEQLRSDLARLEKLPEFTEAVMERVDDIIRTVSASEDGLRLLSGLGSKNGTEIYNTYIDLKEVRPNRPAGAGLVGFVDKELLNPADRARVEAAEQAQARFDAERRLTPDQKVFAQLASSVLAANGELRMRLISLEYAKMHPEFQAQVTAVGEKFRTAFEKDPANAIKQLLKMASSLKAKEMDARAAWLRLNKTVLREIAKWKDLDEAVKIDQMTVASAEWKQLVNQIIADNSKLAPTFRIPDAELEHVGKETVWNEFTGRQQLRSPSGGVYDVDLGFTKASVSRAQDQMQMYLADVSSWLGDPANADNPDRNYWQMRYDFVDSALNVSTALKPTATYAALGIKGPWGMMEFLFKSATLPASKIAFTASNNFQRAWSIQDQWFQGTAPELRFRLAAAARSHGLSPDMDMKRYREDVLDRLASEYRHGNVIKAGDRLNNGMTVTQQDLDALHFQGRKISELFNSVRNLARERVMQDGLIIDDWLPNVFTVRAPQEIGALPGTTLPHEFSERGKALARLVGALSPGDFGKLTALLNQPENFDQFVKRFVAERRADYSEITPFEDLYKQMAAAWRNNDPDAPRSIEEIIDFLKSNSPEDLTHKQIASVFLGEMDGQLRKFYRNFVAKEEPSDVRANRASKQSAFTKGFQREVGSSFFYEYGAVNAGEVRSMGIDSTNFHMVRFVRALDAAVEAYKNALAQYDVVTSVAGKRGLEKAGRAPFKAAEDFRDFERLTSELQDINYLRKTITTAYGSQQIQTIELFSSMGRFTGDFVSAALTGPITGAKIYTGSIVKMGLVMGGINRWYMGAFARGAVATVFSTLEMGGKFAGKAIVKAPGKAVEFVRDAREHGVMIAAAKATQEALEGFYQQGRFFNQQYQFGLGFRSPAGFRAINILTQPYSHGGYYEPKFSSLALIRMPQKAFYRILSTVEAPLEILKAMFPNTFYAISYDAAARAAGWTMDAIGSQARRAFERLEKSGDLAQYDLEHPSDRKNLLPAAYILPRGLFPKGETNLYQARDWWQRAIDVPLNEMVINYWRKLVATPKEERGSVSFLAADVADPAKIKQVEDARAAALMAILLKDVHHASVENRPIQWRQDTTWRFLFPLMGWTAQSGRGFLQAMGRAPTDSRNRMLLTAASAATVLGFVASAILLGEAEKDLKKEVAEGINGEVYPEKTLTEAQSPEDAAKLAAIDSVSWLPLAHNFASELLGESAQSMSQNGISMFTLQKLGSVFRYAKGVIATGDPAYGLAALGKQLLPFGRRFINDLDSQKGLVELRNARTIVQKFGPTDLLGKEQAPEYREPTQLSPYKQALSNAVFKGDAAEVAKAGADFEAKAVALGKTPDEARALLRQAMASIDPVSIGGRKMTDAQHDAMLAELGTHDSAILARAEKNWNDASQSFGLTEQLTKQPRGAGGFSSAGGGVPLPKSRNRLRQTGNRFRLPRAARSGRVRKGTPKIRVTKLHQPRQTMRLRFGLKKPRNRLRHKRQLKYT